MRKEEKYGKILGLAGRKKKDSYAYEQDFLRLAERVEAAMERGLHTLAVTSAGAGQGKTMTAVHLAEALAQRQKRVMVIDADLTGPGLQKHFVHVMPETRPLEQYLQGKCREKELVGYDSARNIYYILNDRPERQLSAVAGKRLKQLIEACGEIMDYVIVDGPSMNQGGLAEELAADCDASLLVTKKRTLRSARTEDAAEELAVMSSCYLGCIINQVRGQTALRTQRGTCRKPELSVRMKTYRHGLRRSIRRLLWTLPLSVLTPAAACFLATNRGYHPLTAAAPYDPWPGILTGAAAGFAVWTAAVLLLAVREKTICTPEQVRAYLGIRCLCELPGGRLQRKKKQARYRSSLETAAKKLEKQRKNSEEGGHLVMVTETQEGEGKSTLAWNLAKLLSEAGARVVLIDTDLHHPVLSRWLTEEKKEKIHWDLVDVLEERAELAEALRQLKEGFVFLGMTKKLRQPYAFLRTAGMRQILLQLRQGADYVIVDAPPVSGAEAECIARQADSILYAIGHDRTEPAHVWGGLEQLRLWKKEAVGAVICRPVQ